MVKMEPEKEIMMGMGMGIDEKTEKKRMWKERK